MMRKKLNEEIENAFKNSPYNFERNIKVPNKDKLGSIRKKIGQELWEILANNQIIVGATGSDGREENLPNSSKLDLIVYCQGKGNLGSELVGVLKEIEPSIESIELVKVEKGWELLYYWDEKLPNFFQQDF